MKPFIEPTLYLISLLAINGMKEIIPRKNYVDICDMVRQLETPLKFDDIVEGEIYHIPPFYYTHKRTNLKVLEKKENYIKCQMYKEGTNYPFIDYLYRTGFDAKFICKYKKVPNSLKKLFDLPF